MKYEVSFGRMQENIFHVTVAFGVINDEFEGEEYMMTNKGEVYSVMNTIVRVIMMYYEEHPYVKTFQFSGEPKEGEAEDQPTQRIKLYYRYALRVFDPKEWEIKLNKNEILINKKEK